MRETTGAVTENFPIRQCENSVYRNRSRPCLQYQIGRCLGPALQDWSARRVHATGGGMSVVLSGRAAEVLTQLIARMEKASPKDLAFERGGAYSRSDRAVRRVTETVCLQCGRRSRRYRRGFLMRYGLYCMCCLFAPGKVRWAARSYFPKVHGGTNWAKWWKRCPGSFTCRVARCARYRARYCSICNA